MSAKHMDRQIRQVLEWNVIVCWVDWTKNSSRIRQRLSRNQWLTKTLLSEKLNLKKLNLFFLGQSSIKLLNAFLLLAEARWERASLSLTLFNYRRKLSHEKTSKFIHFQHSSSLAHVHPKNQRIQKTVGKVERVHAYNWRGFQTPKLAVEPCMFIWTRARFEKGE